MTVCNILQKYITEFKNNQGYYPGYQQCFNYLQGSDMNEIQMSNCMEQYVSNPRMNGNLYNNNSQVQFRANKKSSIPNYNNGNISMGVL